MKTKFNESLISLNKEIDFIGFGVDADHKQTQMLSHLSLYYNGDREEMLGIFVTRCIFNGKTKLSFE